MSAGSSRDLGFVHRFEPATDADAPALLLLHGTGGDEEDLIPLGQHIAAGAALLSPRGKVLEHGMPRFFRRFADGVFDQQDVAFRTTELAEFIARASQVYGVDLTRLIAIGFSNGANIAASILLRFPETLAGAILIRSMPPFHPAESPNLHRKPILMLSGTDDHIVSRAQSEELASIFSAAEADVTLHWERAGHALTQGDMLTARDWLRKLYHKH